MILRPLDWLLMLIGVAAVVAGLLLTPGCHQVNGPFLGMPQRCAESRFPIEIASGVALAVVALLIVGLRVRRSSH